MERGGLHDSSPSALNRGTAMPIIASSYASQR
jgi:hypothetical protein